MVQRWRKMATNGIVIRIFIEILAISSIFDKKKGRRGKKIALQTTVCKAI
jgi:hypothetical protein